MSRGKNFIKYDRYLQLLNIIVKEWEWNEKLFKKKFLPLCCWIKYELIIFEIWRLPYFIQLPPTACLSYSLFERMLWKHKLGSDKILKCCFYFTFTQFSYTTQYKSISFRYTFFTSFIFICLIKEWIKLNQMEGIHFT